MISLVSIAYSLASTGQGDIDEAVERRSVHSKFTLKNARRHGEKPSAPFGSVGVGAQSFQNVLNRSGAMSVYRTVCAIFLCPK